MDKRHYVEMEREQARCVPFTRMIFCSWSRWSDMETWDGAYKRINFEDKRDRNEKETGEKGDRQECHLLCVKINILNKGQFG
jgi:hypothetical protein